MTLIDKCRAVYKGDIMLSIIYVAIAFVFIVTSILLLKFTERIGWFYLSVGMIIFAIYALAKGISMYIVSKERYSHYKDSLDLTSSQFKDEEQYTMYRLSKKSVNRRRYAYTLVIGIILLVIGMFIQERGLVLGTTIPIVLFASIEFVIGLATEFRLWEYQRNIEKIKNN